MFFEPSFNVVCLANIKSIGGCAENVNGVGHLFCLGLSVSV